MDLKSVLVVMMLVAMARALCSTESKDKLKATGTNVTFNFSSGGYFHLFQPFLYIRHGNLTIVDKINSIHNNTDLYNIHPSYTKRVIINGTADPRFIYWNINITLLNVSQTDAGQYELMSRRPNRIANASFCLYVLDLPAVYIPDSSTFDNGTLAMEGEDLIISGTTAKILPNSSHYDVRMTWLLNDEEISPGGPFTVRENMLIIWPIPASFHGANVIYRATVAGHDATTAMAIQLFVLSKSKIDVALHPIQSLYAVTEGSLIPNVTCDVTYSLPTRISWTRDKDVISNNSLLSLGRVERSMSGEYTCSVVVVGTGVSKDKSIFIIVDENHGIPIGNAPEVKEKLTASLTITLSTITGLLVVSLIVTWIFLGRKNIGKLCTKTDQDVKKIARTPEMPAYTVLRQDALGQQLYEITDSSITTEPPSPLPKNYKHHIYENQLLL